MIPKHNRIRLTITLLTLFFMVLGGAFIHGEYKEGKNRKNLSTVSGKKQHNDNQLIIEAATKKDVKKALKPYDLTIKKKFKHLSQKKGRWIGVVKGVRKSSTAIADIVPGLRAAPGIHRVTYDYLVETATVPNDTDFSQLWGMHNTGQTGGTADADIDAAEAWDLATGSPDIIVAVVDTGVDYTHQDLSPNMWRNPGEIAGNGVDDDGNGYTDDIYGIDTVNGDADPMDDHYHGTHCAGTIGAKGNDGYGVAGVNWDVKIMALKFLNSSGSGSISNAVICYDYIIDMKQAGENIVVISNSWGGGGYMQEMLDAINTAGQEGMLSVCAAGNDSTDTDQTVYYPQGYNSNYIISVAATDHNDSLASFSNWGLTSVDLAAPGVSTWSTSPGNSFRSLSGTSMAAPHVSGAVGLLAQLFPGDTPLERKDRIVNYVDLVPAMDGICVTGGRLNLFNAVQSAPFVAAEYSWTKNGELTRVFTDESTAHGCTITGWAWNFGDGNSSTQQNPSHTYAAGGWYDVTLTLTADTGATDAVTKTIWAGPNLAPTADFSYTAPGGFDGAFTDASVDQDGTVVGWSWNFGDGNTSTDQNPTHHYRYPGTYSVTLTATDDEGGSGSVTKSVVIPLSYCPSSGSSASPVAIGRVTIANLDNSSGKNTYSDFTNLTANMSGGQTYSITITTDSTFWDTYTRVYIDYNLDGDFNDANEIAFQDFIDNGTITGTITVPATAENGRLLGMRVSASTNSYRAPCAYNSNWGEVEDYSVLLGQGSNNPPVAGFGYSINNLAVTFSDQSTDDGTIASWSWNFGDGTASTAQNPSHTYASAGTYSVTLTVTDDQGATDSTTQSITVTEAPANQPPTAGFTFSTSNLTANFTDTSSDSDGIVVSRSWNFGDGSTTTQQNPSHTYGSAGTYSVTLTVTDNDGATDSVTQSVTVSSAPVNQPPTADFSFSTNELTATFTDGSGDSDGSIVSYQWEFGDNASSSQQNPVHTYMFAGTYSVTLMVTDNAGAEDSVTKEITVSSTPSNQPPIAGFTFTTDQLTVTFTDTSGDSDGTIISRFWDFGDGDTSPQQDPVHTYAAAGTYTVTLTVQDNDAAEDTITQTVTVTDGGGTLPVYCESRGSSNVIGYISNVTVGTFSNTSGEDLYTDFTNLTAGMTVGNSYSVSLTPTTVYQHYDAKWRVYIDFNRDGDFGDPGEIALQGVVINPNNSPMTGTITVPAGAVVGQPLGMRVSVRFDGGATSFREACSTSGWGEVEDYAVIISGGGGNTPPTANFTAVTDQLTANFTDTSTDSDGTIVSWSWDFGDGNTSTQQNPSHTYAAAGTYSVILTVTDNSGASDNVSKDVTVAETGNTSPTADFSYSIDGNTVSFTDMSTDPDGVIVSWSWDFGDGNTSAQQDPVNIYASAGTYTVTLTVTDNEGASGSATQQITLVDGGVPDYCPSRGSTIAAGGYISEVVVGGFSNASGGDVYTDFTNLTVNLAQGQTYNISLDAVNTSSIWDGKWRIYIDYNRDGDFGDSGEIAFEGLIENQDDRAITGTITVPAGAVTGQKLGMRVSVTYDGGAASFREPCQTNGWGEVEDYAVVIQ